MLILEIRNHFSMPGPGTSLSSFYFCHQRSEKLNISQNIVSESSLNKYPFLSSSRKHSPLPLLPPITYSALRDAVYFPCSETRYALVSGLKPVISSCTPEPLAMESLQSEICIHALISLPSASFPGFPNDCPAAFHCTPGGLLLLCLSEPSFLGFSTSLQT